MCKWKITVTGAGLSTDPPDVPEIRRLAWFYPYPRIAGRPIYGIAETVKGDKLQFAITAGTVIVAESNADTELLREFLAPGKKLTIRKLVGLVYLAAHANHPTWLQYAWNRELGSAGSLTLYRIIRGSGEEVLDPIVLFDPVIIAGVVWGGDE